MNHVVHTMPLWITCNEDWDVLKNCLLSLSLSDPGGHLVVYNQGMADWRTINDLIKSYGLNPCVLGDGSENIGIPAARQKCFEFIWDRSTFQFPDVRYITEIHVDMLFPKDWVKVLSYYLDTHDEPMICPGILTINGELQPEGIHINIDEASIPNWLMILKSTHIGPGFVHPVMHKNEALRAIGGYDITMLTGKQGWEDDSLLVGYRYYMGLRNDWVPKCNCNTRVFHATIMQRRKVEMTTHNLAGLTRKYGVAGFEQLHKLYPQDETFREIVHQIYGDEHDE